MDDETIHQVNVELAQRIHKEALADPSSLRRLLEIEPNKWRCCCFEAGRVTYV
jgi:hypothetical protein